MVRVYSDVISLLRGATSVTCPLVLAKGGLFQVVHPSLEVQDLTPIGLLKTTARNSSLHPWLDADIKIQWSKRPWHLNPLARQFSMGKWMEKGRNCVERISVYIFISGFSTFEWGDPGLHCTALGGWRWSLIRSQSQSRMKKFVKGHNWNTLDSFCYRYCRNTLTNKRCCQNACLKKRLNLRNLEYYS